MNSSRILIPAVALALLGALPAHAGMTPIHSPYSQGSSRVSNVPTMGLTYPAAPAQPGDAVPYSAQRTTEDNGNGSDASSSSSTGDNQSGQSTGSGAPLFLNNKDMKSTVTTYDSHGFPYGEHYYKKHSHDMTLALLRRPELREGQFILHLTTQYAVTGCAKLSNIPSTVDFKEDSVEITLDDYTVDMRNMPHAPEYACHTRPRAPSADIILDRSDLVSKGIKQIKLKMGQYSDVYDIDLNPQRIRLTPSSLMQRTPPMFKPVTSSSLVTPLTHWFYPKNTVILYVPGAPKGQEVENAVESMAKAKGLEPINDEFPDFMSPISTPDSYYFVDTKGAVAHNPDIAAGTVAGTIPVTETVYGLEKDEQETKNIQVFARAPNAYE